MRRTFLPLLALPFLNFPPLAAQAWDIRIEAPFPLGRDLPNLVSLAGWPTSGRLDTGKGAIFSVSHRLIRFGPILRLEWGAEFSRWEAAGHVSYGNSSFSPSLKQIGPGLGANAQLWVPFTGICGEIGAIQRFQQHKYSIEGYEPYETTKGKTWLRAGLRWRVPFIPLLHPYIAASYQEPLGKQKERIDSAQGPADYFMLGADHEAQRLLTFGAGITF